MSKWEITNIGDVFTRIKNGASIKQSAGASGLPITRIETIWNSEVDRKKFGFADISDSKKYEDYLLQDKDILMSHINSMKHLAKSALYKKVNGETIIHGMNLICLRTDKEKLDEKFAHYFFNSPSFKNQIPKIANQSVNQSSFSITKFRTLKIPLPPLAIQKQIAELLDTADALRRQTQAQLDQLDALAQSVFLEMFGDPVLNVKEWEIKKLGDLCEKITDGTHKTPKYQNEGVIFLSAKNIKKYRLNQINPKYISEEEHQNLIKRCPVKKGDILITKSGSLGMAAMVEFDFEFSIFESLALIKFYREKIIGKFLLYFLNNPTTQFQYHRITKGVGVKHLHLGDLRKLNIILPPLPLQSQFTEIIENIEMQKEQLEASLRESEGLFGGLLQEVFG